jgi:hypothetical protein
VIVLGPHGHATVRDDPFLLTPPFTPAPEAGVASARRPTRKRRGAERNVRSELARMKRRHQISQSQYNQYLGSFNSALNAQHRLRGTRAVELEAVIQNLHGIAASGQLTPSRLPALFLTLDRNRSWWTTGPLLSSGQRVEFAGSEIVWEYYPGQGIELQVLGSFGKADGLYTAGPSDYPALRQALAELIPLASSRGGGLTWEYYFHFDGGSPPWTSAMSQGTALEALTRAYEAFNDVSYLNVARRAMPIFSHGPPLGVTVGTPRGKRYLLYSFAGGPGEAVLNGFLQTLIGLFDYGHASGNAQALALFAAGDREARYEVPHYDTGAWSLYQPGQESTLDYHELVTGFLQQLCERVQAAVYCQTADRFETDLTTAPALRLLTGRLPAKKAAALRFSLSKESHVGIVILSGSGIVFQTSATFPYGTHSFSTPALNRGTYTVHLAATDLASNFGRIVTTLKVS